MRILFTVAAALTLLVLAARAEDDLAIRAKALIQMLGSEKFEEREAAAKELAAMGKKAEAVLRDAAAQCSDPEVQARLDALIDECNWGDAVDGLRMRIFAAAEVQAGQPFVLTVRLQNVSDKAQTFGDWVPYDVSLYKVQVVDQTTGQEVTWKDQPRDYDKHFIVPHTIPPGETFEASILLHEGTFTPALVAGHTLQVRVAYEMRRDELGSVCWQRKLSSAPIEVRVAK